MVSFLDPALAPRDGNTLWVLLVGRVSSPGPGKQSLTSLDDQETILRRWLERHFDGPVKITVIMGSGSGEILDRQEHLDLLQHIEYDRPDLVLAEDLGRILRRATAIQVCELCEDHAVRLIAINNAGMDTAKPGWREAALFAGFRYEQENRDKSIRIKERLRAQFISGGALPGLIAGYVKPEGAKRDSKVKKDPDWEPIYKEWFRKLDEDNATYSEIADWLNKQGIPVSKSCQTKSIWDCALVGTNTRNSLLKGLRVHNDRKTRRINKSGRYKSEKAPPELRLTREVPHLAFFEPDYYDRVLAKMKRRNAHFSRANKGNVDPLANRARKRTRFPGQIIECGVCGRGFVFGGHGQTDHLMCQGAREYRCWNGITVDAEIARVNIPDAIFTELETFKSFSSVMIDEIRQVARQLNSDRDTSIRAVTSKLANCQRKLKKLMNVLGEGHRTSRTILATLAELENDERRLELELSELNSRPRDEIVIPSSNEIRTLCREEMNGMARDSLEFGDLMRRIVPKIVVQPMRSCDGGRIFLTSEFRLHVTNLIPNVSSRETLETAFERRLSVPLYEPPQRLKYREQIMELRSLINPATGRKYTEAEAAAIVGITKTAAQRAASLQRHGKRSLVNSNREFSRSLFCQTENFSARQNFRGWQDRRQA